MTMYPARVVEVRPRTDPDHHPPASVLAQPDPDEPEPEASPPEDELVERFPQV
jgi:hypothetical protein